MLDLECNMTMLEAQWKAESVTILRLSSFFVFFFIIEMIVHVDIYNACWSYFDLGFWVLGFGQVQFFNLFKINVWLQVVVWTFSEKKKRLLSGPFALWCGIFYFFWVIWCGIWTLTVWVYAWLSKNGYETRICDLLKHIRLKISGFKLVSVRSTLMTRILMIISEFSFKFSYLKSSNQPWVTQLLYQWLAWLKCFSNLSPYSVPDLM